MYTWTCHWPCVHPTEWPGDHTSCSFRSWNVELYCNKTCRTLVWKRYEQMGIWPVITIFSYLLACFTPFEWDSSGCRSWNWDPSRSHAHAGNLQGTQDYLREKKKHRFLWHFRETIIHGKENQLQMEVLWGFTKKINYKWRFYLVLICFDEVLLRINYKWWFYIVLMRFY